MAKTKYYESEFGPFWYPHLNKPDDKFNKDNPVFKLTLVLIGEAAQRQKERIDRAVAEAFEAFMDDPEQGGKISAKDRAKWSKHYPYEEMEDEEGTIKFHFKQNSTLRLKDGTTKTIQIGLYDAKGKEMPEDVFIRHLSEGRVGYSMRPIKITTAKEFGIRLDFSKVQITKLSEGQGGGGFGAVDGGFEYDEEDTPRGGFSSSSNEDGSGDY